MQSRPPVTESRWIIFAIPAAVILIPLATALIVLAVRPARKPPDDVAVRETAPTRVEEPSPPAEVPVESPAPAPSTPPEPPAPALVATNTPPAPPPPTVTPKPPPSPPASKSSGAATDLLASLDMSVAAIAGEWQKDGGTIQCKSASSAKRAKLRLAPPPPGDGYDLAITFTAQGERRFVAPILSFRGRQFIFAMMSGQSGFASVRGQNALANETTRPKGIAAGKKHTLLMKVRDREVSAHLDGELVSNYATDYSDLDVSNAWNLGPSSTRESLLGFAIECPVTIDAITLTPLDAKPATTAPAPSSYKDVAAMISSAFSRESSAAATQPASAGRLSEGDLRTIAAASQPVVSDVAANLLANAPATDQAAREDLFRAVQVSIAPAGLPPDPLQDASPINQVPAAISRGDFDAEQTRLAAWRTLMGRMSELYPDAKSQRDLIKIRLAPEGENKAKIASFFANHSHSEPLTNVTLAVEIVHAMTNPSPTAVQYYYIKRWPAGQKIFFPAACVPNVASRELLESAGPSPLNDLSGIIEVRAQLWSDKVMQPTQAISFDNNFQNIAHAQLNYAYGLIDDALRRPPTASRPASTPPASPTARATGLIVGPIMPIRAELNEDVPEVARAKALARRARGLLPPQSSQADGARDLVAQPLAALRDLRKRQVDAFVAALPPRSSRAGVWINHRPGMLAKLVKSADRDAAVNAAGADGGRITLTIDSCSSDGMSVAVTLTSSGPPELKRKFSGRLLVDASANRVLLNLRATQPPPPRKNAEDLKRIVHWNSLLLELRGNTLVGIATAGPTESATVFNVGFGPPTPAAGAAPPKGRTKS